MAVALERQHLVDVQRAEVDDPPHVVAGQVDQHDVLGHLLRVLAELGADPSVLLVGLPRQRVPAIGREMTRSSRSCTIGSGEQPTRDSRGRRTKYMYGLGFTWRSTR